MTLHENGQTSGCNAERWDQVVVLVVTMGWDGQEPRDIYRGFPGYLFTDISWPFIFSFLWSQGRRDFAAIWIYLPAEFMDLHIFYCIWPTSDSVFVGYWSKDLTTYSFQRGGYLKYPPDHPWEWRLLSSVASNLCLLQWPDLEEQWGVSK